MTASLVMRGPSKKFDWTIEAPSLENRDAKVLSGMLPLDPVYRFKRDDYRGIQFMYHNIQSLPDHYEDMMADPRFMQSDLILLAETWTLRSDNFVIPGFELVERGDGLHVYVTDRLKGKCFDSWHSNAGGLQMAVVYVLDNFKFALLYADPQMSTDEKINGIWRGIGYYSGLKTILVGNFNVNFDTPEGREFADQLSTENFHLRTNPKHHTTRDGRTIDAIFSNHSMRTGDYTSTYGYRTPLYGRIDYKKGPEKYL